jgi:hypothetical protein
MGGGRLNEFPTACESYFFTSAVAHATAVFIVESVASEENGYKFFFIVLL